MLPDTRWYEPDYQGSTRKVVDDRGGSISSFDFDAFGNVTPASGVTWVPLHLYEGGLSDPDTHLVNMEARWDDPASGRFTSQDPLGVGTNPYPYVNNDPMNLWDPSGMSPGWVSK